jgi:uncharacterized membrane protein YeaQ/YmgE (transglycosylase-associated protein family)
MTMHYSDIIGAIIVGVVVGTLGRLVLPGKQDIGKFVTVLIGVAAAVLGGYLTNRFGYADKAPQKLWFLHWDWVVLGVQVVLAAIGTAVAVPFSRKLSTDAPKRATARKKASARKA